MTTEPMSISTTIAECNTKELANILAEALDKLTPFQEACDMLKKLEAFSQFYYHLLTDTLNGKINAPRSLEEIQSARHSFLSDVPDDELWQQIGKHMPKHKTLEAVINAGASKVPNSPFGNRGYGYPSQISAVYEAFAKEAEGFKLQVLMEAEKLETNGKIVLLIPPDYRYIFALKTMLGYVRNMRATTWARCVDLYEEQLHRWKLEANSAEAIEIQRQTQNLATQAASLSSRAATNSSISAIFSGLNLIFR